MNSVPILHTDRCVLSAVTSADITVLCQILDDADTQRFLPELCEVFQTEESLKQFIDSFDSYLQHDEGILWGIHKEDTFIGFIAIMDIPDTPALFYAMHPAYRNFGYMKECLAQLMYFIRDNKVCQWLQSEVYCDNAISQKLLGEMGLRVYKENEYKSFFRFESESH